MKRTDVHAPSVIIPEDYSFVAFEYIKTDSDIGACAFLNEQRSVIRAHMATTGGTYSRHEHGGSCHICGASCIYTVLFYHEKTNSYIRTGNDCAEKLEMMFGDHNAFATEVRHAVGVAKGKKAAAAKWLEAGLGRAYEIALEGRTMLAIEWPTSPKDKHGDDIGATIDRHPENQAALDEYEAAVAACRRLERERYTRWEAGYKLGDMLKTTEMYGTLSEKMIPAITRLAAKHDAYEQKMAERAAENEAAADCPQGKRLEIVGTVLSLKEQESQFGTVTKMLVKHESGYKVWSTLPAALWDAKVGDVVTFVATIERSPSDAKFGFASRPTAKKILAGVAA